MANIPHEIALRDLMAFPLRGVRHGTNEVINFPGVASSLEESEVPVHAIETPIDLGYVRENPTDLTDNPDSQTSPIDRSSPIHEPTPDPNDDTHQNSQIPLLNQNDEVDKANAEILESESPLDEKRTSPEEITHPFTMNMGVQTSYIHSPVQELTLEVVVTNTNTFIAQESLVIT
ncbi:uncharacterized protein LOC114284437 [Camellia sinensis]|uniref:uncharacterized protein LOC114284437 n=1 Tax=Camellia sinensis TaxID=4442 RepID=UPI001036921E|nr:uncharacterized protein LOC114284437 [Camellia sinensis]